MKTTKEKQQQEIQMFGETIEQMRAGMIFTNPNDPAQLNMYAMGILSDAQHVLARERELVHDREVARKWINKAKYWLSESMRLIRERPAVDRARGGNPPAPNADKKLQLLALAHHAVSDVFSEFGNLDPEKHDWWIYLKAGWCNAPETHTIHEQTLEECIDELLAIKPCSCADCERSKS